MSKQPSPFCVVILSQDSELDETFDPGEGRVSVVRTLDALKEALTTGEYQGVVVDGITCPLGELASINGNMDLSRVVVLAGPRTGMHKVVRLVQSVLKPAGKHSRQQEVSLTDYVQTKFEDFVRAMRQGSARDIYPMLMQAVERPLIELALRETDGNQMQAARLLGMNRNTLKKKIVEFQIDVPRSKTRRRNRDTS